MVLTVLIIIIMIVVTLYRIWMYSYQDKFPVADFLVDVVHVQGLQSIMLPVPQAAYWWDECSLFTRKHLDTHIHTNLFRDIYRLY